MSSIASTLPFQIDGLLKIYTHERHTFFKFENQEKLQKAKDAFMLYVKNSHMFYLNESILPEYTEFVFGVSTDAFIKQPIEKLIRQVAKIITTEASLKKDIPIIPITMEQLIYKG